METTTSTVASERTDAISAAAATVLRGRGFASVGIDEIAAAAGLTGPALYRYYDGKYDVLADVVERFLRALEQCAATGDSIELAELADLVVATPDAASVTVRQAGLLEPAVHERLLGSTSTRVRRVLPVSDLMPVADRVRMRALYGAAIHCGLHRVGTLASRQRAARAAAEALSRVPVELGVPEPEPRGRVLQQSRREAVMAVAMDLFSQRGFGGVSLRDIGAELGVTASAVSRHFPSKEELLTALFERASEQIGAAFQTAFRRASDPSDALIRLLRGYSAMAVDNRELIIIYISERNSLSEVNRERRRGNQRGYAAELRHLLELNVPGLSRAEAQLRATLAFSVINEVLFDEDACRHGALAEVLAELARSAVTSPAGPAARSSKRKEPA